VNRTLINGPVLDVGCGTGMVGTCLRQAGVDLVDGADISLPMLAEAGNKKTVDGDPVYRNLIPADLTRSIDIPDNQYAALVSAGTITEPDLVEVPMYSTQAVDPEHANDRAYIVVCQLGLPRRQASISPIA
jgi:SAM-dependent methyltransferase